MILSINNILEMTISQIVIQDYRASEIFDKYNIDYYNRGFEKFANACKARGIKPEKIINELERLKKASGDNEEDYNTLSVDALIEEIEFKRHGFFIERAAEIKNFLNSLNRIHGKNDSGLSDVIDIFYHFSSETNIHLMKERLVLFPYIKELSEVEKLNYLSTNFNFLAFDLTVELMKAEHNKETDYINKISAIINNYLLPDKDEGYQIAYMLFKSLKEELIRTIHLENNILFPKAIELEGKVREKMQLQV